MFEHWIAKPIKENKAEGFTRLQTLVRSTCLRRTKESIGGVLNLPPRQEKIEPVYLSQQDQTLYDFFKEKSASLVSGTQTGHAAVTLSQNNQRGGVICLLNFLKTGDVSMRDINDELPRYSAKVLALLRNLLVAHTRTDDINEDYIPAKRCERMHTSLRRMLTKTSVVFSYSTKMLDLIEQALSHYQFRTCRIDGSTSLEGRSNLLREFSEDIHCAVMLATIGSAGEG
jgi:SNF2 family DNA or RNA helicase